MSVYSNMWYDSVDLSGSTYSVEVLDAEIPPVPQPRIDVQPVPYGGGISQGEYFEPATIRVAVAVTGTSRENVNTKLRALAALFHTQSDKTLYFDFYNDYQWKGRRQSSQTRWQGTDMVEMDWQFLLPDPIGESRLTITETYSPTNNAYTFYVPSTGGTVIGGNYTARPKITIKATGACAANIVLTNVSTTEAITYTVALANTHWLEIDSSLYSVRKSTDGGATFASAVGSITNTSVFPTLDDGVRNEFLLTNCDNSTVEVVYRTRIIGG